MMQIDTAAIPPSAWEQGSWQAAVFTALFAALVAMAQGLWALWQRREELRWKQSELARQLTNVWFDWQASDNALRMVDEGAGEYSLERYGKVTLDPRIAIPRALKLTGLGRTAEVVSDMPEDRFVRKCFDVLLFCFERVEHSIQIGVVHKKDVVVPTEYYAARLARYKSDIEAYARFTGFNRALKLLERFDGWTHP
jgi:hypothetical protein